MRRIYSAPIIRYTKYGYIVQQVACMTCWSAKSSLCLHNSNRKKNRSDEPFNWIKRPVKLPKPASRTKSQQHRRDECKMLTLSHHFKARSPYTENNTITDAVDGTKTDNSSTKSLTDLWRGARWIGLIRGRQVRCARAFPLISLIGARWGPPWAPL